MPRAGASARPPARRVPPARCAAVAPRLAPQLEAYPNPARDAVRVRVLHADPAGLAPRTVQLERVPPVKNLSVSLLPRGEVSRLVPEEYDTL